MSFLVLALPVRRQVSFGLNKPVKFAVRPHLARYTFSSMSCATNRAHACRGVWPDISEDRSRKYDP